VVGRSAGSIEDREPAAPPATGIAQWRRVAQPRARRFVRHARSLPRPEAAGGPEMQYFAL